MDLFKFRRLATASLCIGATVVAAAGCTQKVPASMRTACLSAVAGGTTVSIDGYPLAVVVDAWEKSGASVRLHQEGQFQVLDISGRSPVTAEHLGISVRMRPDIEPTLSDQCGPTGLSVVAMKVNGDLVTDMNMQDVVFPFVLTAARDLGLPKPIFPPSKPTRSEVAQPPPREASARNGMMPDSTIPSLSPTAGAPAAMGNGISPVGAVSGDCRVQNSGHEVMAGVCRGKSDGSSVVVTAEHGGCTVELTPTADGARGKLYGYRDTCWIDEAKGTSVDDDVDLGALSKQGRCWVGPSAKICL